MSRSKSPIVIASLYLVWLAGVLFSPAFYILLLIALALAVLGFLGEGEKTWPSVALALLIASAIAVRISFSGPAGASFAAALSFFLFPPWTTILFLTIWPLLVGMQALFFHRPSPGRFRAAVAAFVASCIWWTYMVVSKTRFEKRIVQETARLEEAREQRKALDSEILQTLQQRGLSAYDEPLPWRVQENISSYVSLKFKEIPPEQFIAAANHYRDPRVMEELATAPSCPLEALAVLFDHVAEEDRTFRGTLAPLNEVALAIAQNPNASEDLLVKMMRSDSPSAHAAALQASKLPAGEKARFLRNGCAYPQLRDRQTVALNPDTPPETLDCLSADPELTPSLTANPAIPIGTLERMSASSNPNISYSGKAALQRRQGR